MKINVLSYDDSEEDCRRETYYTVVDGKQFVLAGMALGGYNTFLEIQENARKRFGDDVVLDLSEVRFLRTEPY